MRWLISFLILRGVRRAFHAFHTAEESALSEAASENRSILLLANHTNWWDGFIAHVISKKCLPRHSPHLLQEAAQLAAAPFFKSVGAMPLDIAKPLAAMRAASRLLAEDGHILWYFPQGRVHHPSTPIVAQRGAEFLAKRAMASRAAVVPVDFRYEWLVESRATVLVRFGVPFQTPPSATEIASAIWQLHLQTAETLDPIELSDYKPLFAPRLSLNKKWEWVAAACTGRLSQFHNRNEQ